MLVEPVKKTAEKVKMMEMDADLGRLPSSRQGRKVDRQDLVTLVVDHREVEDRLVGISPTIDADLMGETLKPRLTVKTTNRPVIIEDHGDDDVVDQETTDQTVVIRMMIIFVMNVISQKRS